MTLSFRSVFTLLLVVTVGPLAEGQTVLDDFESGFNNFFPFGVGTISQDNFGLISDCGTAGNECASHAMNFTAPVTSPFAFGFGDIGPFFAPTTIDLSPYIGYSIDARFIRTGIANPNAPIPQEDFTGLSPIKFGVQWDPNDACGTSMNACSDLYGTPVELTETFQTFTVMFDDFLMGKPRNSAQFKMLMLAGDFDPAAPSPVQFDSGDFDASFSVDGADFLNWQRHFAETDPDGGAARFDHGNANIGTPVVNSIIDGNDLTIWEDQFGRTDAPIADWSRGVGRFEFDNIIGILPPSPGNASAVPEPTSCWLVFCYGCLLTCSGRSKR